MVRQTVMSLAILLGVAVPARGDDPAADARVQRLEQQVRELSADLAATRAELAEVRAAVVALRSTPADAPVPRPAYSPPAYTPPPGPSAQDRYRASQRQSKLADVRRLTDAVKSEADWLRYYRSSKGSESSKRYHRGAGSIDCGPTSTRPKPSSTPCNRPDPHGGVYKSDAAMPRR